MASIEKRREGVYRRRFDLPRTDEHPYRRQVSHTFEGSRRDAEAFFRRVQMEIDEGRYAQRNDVTVARLLREWLTVHKSNLAPKTAERYGEICERHLIPSLGKIRVQAVRPGTINKYLAEARDSGRLDGKGGLSEKTLLSFYGVLHEAFKYAAEVGYLGEQRNPCAKARKPKPRRVEARYLKSEQLPTLCEAARGTRMHIPVLLGSYVGLRRGELLALTWEDVDFDRHTLRIVRSLYETGTEIGMKETKTDGSARTVKLAAFLIDELTAHRKEQAAQRLRSRAWVDNDLICPASNGEPWWPSNLTAAFARLIDKTSLPRISFHSLRHSHCTWLAEQRIPVTVAQRRLGHKDPKTTLAIYSHVTDRMQDEVGEALDAAFG